MIALKKSGMSDVVVRGLLRVSQLAHTYHKQHTSNTIAS